MDEFNNNLPEPEDFDQDEAELDELEYEPVTETEAQDEAEPDEAAETPLPPSIRASSSLDRAASLRVML